MINVHGGGVVMVIPIMHVCAYIVCSTEDCYIDFMIDTILKVSELEGSFISLLLRR
jgi:hypothetical protein